MDIVLPSATRVVQEEDMKGIYEIDGFYPGYGNTIGNSLRRILLSSLPGAAITMVKIDGVSHEFSTMEHVSEDVVTILLNLKQLRFRMHGEDPQSATIDISGVKEVKGKDIKCPTQLEVMNKDHHIATLTDKSAHFVVELTVERGLGFVPSENLTREKVPVGTLLLDAIFTPIRRANYEVENMRVGDRTDYNRLRLTIETDGTITPRDAYTHALKIMKAHIEQISRFEGDEAVVTGTSEGVASFAGLHLSPRIQNTLLEAGIMSAEDLSRKTADELLALEGVGEKAVGDIRKALEKEGLSLSE
jgi:DNA-directed RNA polymerase subunit alpha